MRNTRSTFSTGFAFFAAATSAIAQPAPRHPARTSLLPIADSEYERTHARGLELLQQHRDSEAYDLFHALYERHHDLRTLTKLAMAEYGLRRIVEAEAHMAQVLAQTSDPWVIENRERIQASYDIIRGRLGRIRIVCGIQRTRASLTSEGVPARDIPLDTPITTPLGESQIEVTAPGHIPVRANFSVLNVTDRDQRMQLCPVPIPPTSANTHTTPTPIGPGPAVLASVGGVMLATGIVLHVISAQTAQDADASCINDIGGSVCAPSARVQQQTLRSEAITYSTTGTAMIVGGGVAVSAGLAWWLFARTRRDTNTVTTTPIIAVSVNSVALGASVSF
jgi:hypothetical protein